MVLRKHGNQRETCRVELFRQDERSYRISSLSNGNYNVCTSWGLPAALSIDLGVGSSLGACCSNAFSCFICLPRVVSDKSFLTLWCANIHCAGLHHKRYFATKCNAYKIMRTLDHPMVRRNNMRRIGDLLRSNAASWLYQNSMVGWSTLVSRQRMRFITPFTLLNASISYAQLHCEPNMHGKYTTWA